MKAILPAADPADDGRRRCHGTAYRAVTRRSEATLLTPNHDLCDMNQNRAWSEPLHTIYGPQWWNARARIQKLPKKQRAMFARLLDHVETGWRHVRTLQIAYERLEHLARSGDELAQFLDFIDADVVDLFRVVASDAAALVPGLEEWDECADPGDMDGDVSVFTRYLHLLHLAARSPVIPAELDATVRATVDGLDGWSPRLASLLRTIDNKVVRPALAAPRAIAF